MQHQASEVVIKTKALILHLSKEPIQKCKDALKKSSSKTDEYQVRFSRPWVLKGEKLAFTWDFTFRGDIAKALEDLSGVSALKPPVTREEEVPVQTLKPRRGRVRQVSIGAIR